MADEFITLFEKNITRKDIKDAAKDPLAFVSIPKQFDFKVGFTVGEKDYKTHGTIVIEKKNVEAIFNKYHSQLLTTLVFIFKEGNTLSEKPDLKLDDTIKTIKNAADAQYKVIHENCIKDITKLFDEIKAKNAKYRATQFKAVIQFTLSGISLTTSIATLASSPFTLGFSTIMSLMSIVKTAASMAKQIYDTLQTAEQVIKKLEKDLTKVKKKFADDGPHTAEAVKAVGSQLVSNFLGVELIATIKTCQTKFETVEHKLQGTYKALVAIAAKLVKAEKKCAKLAELMKDKNNQALSDEELLKLMNHFASLGKSVREWKAKIDFQEPKFRAMDERVVMISKDLKLLADKNAKLLAFQDGFQTFLDWSSILLAMADAKTLVDAGAKAVDAFKDIVKDKVQQQLIDSASDAAAEAEVRAAGWLKVK